MEKRSQEFSENNSHREQPMKVAQKAEETLWESQHFLQRMREISPSVIYIYDLNTQRSLYVNHQFGQILGYTPSEIVQREEDWLPNLLHPDDRDTVIEHFNGFWDAGDREIVTIEYRIGHKNGEWRWLRSQETVLQRNSEGLPAQILGVAEDITECKQIEEALVESERRFRAIFDHTFQFTWLLKTDGTLLEANQRALDFSGQQRSDVVKRPFWEARWWMSSPGTQEQIKCAIAAASQGEFVRYEVDVRGNGDAAITLDFSIEPFRDETGQVVLLISEGRVISDAVSYTLPEAHTITCYANGFSSEVRDSFASRKPVKSC